MKVLYLIDTLMGYGAETSLVEITRRFKKVEPIFVQIYKGDQLKYILKEHGISVYSLNLTGKYNFRSAEKAVLKIIEKERPQIIHSTLFRADIIARRIKKKFPLIPLVGSLVNNTYLAYRYNEMKFLRRIKHFIVKEWDKQTSKYVDYFIANSEAIIEANVQALNIKKEKIVTIYRGRDLAKFAENRVNPISLPFSKKDSIVYLNVSRLEKRKGHKDLIEAFSHLIKSRPSSKLIIAGEGPERLNLEKLIDHLQIQQSVFLLGYRKDISELLKMADFFVFSSYFEGLPGALVEAVISKIPIIASNIPENRECLAPDSSLLFTPGKIDELHGALKEAINISDWSRKTEIAYDFAKEKFDITIISKKYEDFYFQIIRKELNTSRKKF